ncbi:hypothetical protein H6P81_006751 [Aristolochia fimbriata]|uniref:Uncharacterized protein n=1 Tax=Aristolochia fimbriata TaxID=158543 RepID=A0AAV7EYE4_ARIFI|nr:hypothetical protein H6P81_006751 [Aristolochia fimbriata]
MESGLTTRCSPAVFLETIEKAKLKKKHIRAIKKTPFGHFFEVKSGHIEATLVSSLANKFCKVRNSFLIGKRYMDFSAVEVSNMMGLPFKGSHLVVGTCKKMPDFVVNHFHGKAPNRKEIARKLHRLANYGVPLTLYRYINDLNGLEYAWGEALHKHIVLQLSRKKAKNNGYFTGCALAVTAWYYETMSRLGTFAFCTDKLVDPTAAPCVLKWGSKKVHRSGDIEEVHQQTRDLQEEWEQGEGVAAHPPQADGVIAQLQDEVTQLKLKNATLESALDGVMCIVEDL